MVVASSRNSSRTCQKKFLTAIEDFGWLTRKMNCTLTTVPMRHNVRDFTTLLRFLIKFHFLEAHSLNWYRFIGRILGKALYDGILVDVAFAGFFLAKVSLLFIGFVLADADATPAVVVGKAEFPRRSCLT